MELIERIDLLRVGRHSANNYLTFAAVTYETSGASALGRRRRVGVQTTTVLQKEREQRKEQNCAEVLLYVYIETLCLQ